MLKASETKKAEESKRWFYCGQKGLRMGKAWDHFKTISYHKYLVAKGCFQVGLYRQGILHDLSKYSPSEFMVGARFYQGNRKEGTSIILSIGRIIPVSRRKEEA